MCWISCRDTSEPSEIPSSTSTVWVRIGGSASGRPAIAAMPTAIIAPEISPPGRFAHRNSSAAGGADDERLEHMEDFGAAREWQRPSMRGSGSRRLMANPPRRDKCVTRLQQCAAMLPWRAPDLLNAG